MPIQRADADAGAARDFFQAHIQANFREPRLGGVNEQLSIAGTVGARFARLGRRLAFDVYLICSSHGTCKTEDTSVY